MPQEPFTVANLDRHLRQQWIKKGFELPEHERVGVKVSDLVQHSLERNGALELPFVDLWVAILDECISWLISLVTVFYSARKEKKIDITAFEKSIILLTGKIIADSTAIRQLTIYGFDTSARTILRSVSEYMEVMVAIIHRPVFAEEFVKSETPEAAKIFWELHLRGGKIRRRVTDAWKDFFKDPHQSDAAEWFANWGRTSSELLSGLSHPSLAGGLFTAIPLKAHYTKENWLGFWGDKSESSVETIYIYLHFLFPILLLSREFPFGDSSEDQVNNSSYDENDELKRHVRVGRDVLASLILSLSHENNEKYVFPEIDMSIWSARAQETPIDN